MSAYAGKFLNKSTGAPGVGSFVPVHDRVEEVIQGGAAGDHWHLTAAQYAGLTSPTSIERKIYEPVMAAGEVVTLLSGDCLMAFGGLYAS